MVTLYTFYDTLDNDKPVLVNVKLAEVCDYFNMKTYSPKKHGALFRKRYRVETITREKISKKEKNIISTDFRAEWEKVCRKFRECNWTKEQGEGVRVLVER